MSLSLHGGQAVLQDIVSRLPHQILRLFRKDVLRFLVVVLVVVLCLFGFTLHSHGIEYARANSLEKQLSRWDSERTSGNSQVLQLERELRNVTEQHLRCASDLQGKKKRATRCEAQLSQLRSELQSERNRLRQCEQKQTSFESMLAEANQKLSDSRRRIGRRHVRIDESSDPANHPGYVWWIYDVLRTTLLSVIDLVNLRVRLSIVLSTIVFAILLTTFTSRAPGPLDKSKKNEAAKWTPGSKHPSVPNIEASPKTNHWTPVAGYEWQDGPPSDARLDVSTPLRWVPGRPYLRLANRESSSEAGRYSPSPGYRWTVSPPVDVSTPVVWFPRCEHPRIPNIKSSCLVDLWVPNPGYRWAIGPPNDRRAVSYCASETWAVIRL